jgi:hypothetical protein
MRRCAESRWRGYERGGGLRLTLDDEFERKRSQILQRFGEGFHRFGDILSGKKKGVKGGVLGAFIGDLSLGKKLGFDRGRGDGRRRGVGLVLDSLQS